MDNAAFEEGAEHEAARILRAAAERIAAGTWNQRLLDSNGNTVGKVKLVRHNRKEL